MTFRNVFSGKPAVKKATTPTPPPAVQPPPVAKADPQPPHTLTAFEEALSGLITRAGQMGDSVLKMVDQCAAAFLDRNAALAKQLSQADLNVDAQKDALLAQAIDVLV